MLCLLVSIVEIDCRRIYNVYLIFSTCMCYNTDIVPIVHMHMLCCDFLTDGHQQVKSKFIKVPFSVPNNMCMVLIFLGGGDFLF